VRLAVYTDYTYRQDARGVSGERAFVRFMTATRPLVDRLVLVGRLDVRPGRSHYPLEEGVEFVGLPYYASLTNPGAVLRSLARSMKRFWRALDDVDTVWLLGPYVHAIGFVPLALMRRRRVVLGVRQDLPRYVRSRHPDVRWMHVAADLLESVFRMLARRLPVVVVGPDLARRYRRSATLLELNVSLISAADIVSEADALERATAGQVRRLLSVGRLDREKNPLLLADVMAALTAEDPRWRLVVVGEGPLYEQLQARVEQLGLSEVVQLRGYVPIDGELPELYRSADAFLHVSWTEGVPQVLFEAFAAGLPVVATNVGGVAQAAGAAALLVAPGDAAAALGALRRVAGEPELRERLVKEGLERIRRHTIEAETRRLVAFLRAPHAAGVEVVPTAAQEAGVSL
jgi:glycosyltransferase involved in cell wall biosynthesis